MIFELWLALWIIFAVVFFGEGYGKCRWIKSDRYYFILLCIACILVAIFVLDFIISIYTTISLSEVLQLLFSFYGIIAFLIGLGIFLALVGYLPYKTGCKIGKRRRESLKEKEG